MPNKNITILGAGMAGFGAAFRLKEAGYRPLIFERHAYHGGHATSFTHPGGWIFDDGPHISFTRVDRMRKLFAESVQNEYQSVQAHPNNFWKGHWIKHPTQCNLHGLPTDMIVKIIEDFVAASARDSGPITNYAEWLTASFGTTFAEAFPMQYGRKFHTVDASRMTTDWLGPRIYRPKLEEVLRGALSPQTPDVHYIDDFRYPTLGGFVSYFNGFLNDATLHLNHQLTRIDLRQKKLEFSNGLTCSYDAIVSSIPLPALIPLIADVPCDVLEASRRLAWTQVVVVNIGVGRSDISSAHWTYFYDDDYIFCRLSFPHMLSPHTVPPGAGSIQAEIYFSDKYRPLDGRPEDYIPRVIADLKRCGLLREDDPILFSNATLSPWGQVIFDLDRPKAIETVKGYLDEVGIAVCGRYGEWGYLWTDESFISGENAAERVLERG